MSCRDAAKAHHGLNKDSVNTINHALIQLGVIDPVRIGDARPRGKASEFRYLLPLNADVGAADLQPPNEEAA